MGLGCTISRVLRTVNLLYLGTRVLVLADISYLSRFWTQFEAWLSMQARDLPCSPTLPHDLPRPATLTHALSRSPTSSHDLP